MIQFSAPLYIIRQLPTSESLDTKEIKKVMKICLFLLVSNLLLKRVNVFKYSILMMPQEGLDRASFGPAEEEWWRRV